MSPIFRGRSGRVRTSVGAALALGSLGITCWLICQPASAVHARTGPEHGAAREAAPKGVVVSSFRSVPRLIDPGTPIPEELWFASRTAATVRLDVELARSLVARSIPLEAGLRSDTTAEELEAPIGSVDRLEDGRLCVIDGWTNGREDLQVELRLAVAAEGSPTAEASIFDIRSGEAPLAWTDPEIEVTTSSSSWNTGDTLHLRYRARGVDHAGRRREEGGLVRVRVP